MTITIELTPDELRYLEARVSRMKTKQERQGIEPRQELQAINRKLQTAMQAVQLGLKFEANLSYGAYGRNSDAQSRLAILKEAKAAIEK